MTLTKLLKRSLISACYAFSAVIIIYSLLVIAFYRGLGMEPVSVLLFFPLTFAFSFANGIVRHTDIKGTAKLFSHFILITFALVLFIFIPHGGMLSSGTAVVVFAMYLVLYALCAGIYITIFAKKKKKQEKNTEYKKVF